jgi:ABC-2 type transport system permease protein
MDSAASNVSVPAPRPSWWKYWVILSTRTQEDMAYRVNYIFGAIFRFLPLVTTIYLWYAVFHSPGNGAGLSSIRGMKFEDIVAYYAIMYIARGFSSMPGMTHEISLDIKDGLLNRYLIRPMSYFWYQVMYRLAHKVVFWMVAVVTFPPIFFLIRGYFGHTPSLWDWLGFVFSLVIAFSIGILFCFLVGTLAFWFLEISTFLFVIMTIEFFLSGHLIPLNLLPAVFQPILSYSPFGYEGYWPCMIILGKVPPADLPHLLGIGCLWVAVFFVLAQMLWKAGMRRYSAVGG